MVRDDRYPFTELGRIREKRLFIIIPAEINRRQWADLAQKLSGRPKKDGRGSARDKIEYFGLSMAHFRR